MPPRPPKKTHHDLWRIGHRPAHICAGLFRLKATVELLAPTLRGCLLKGPWVRRNALGGHWLASSDHAVNLSHAITGLDAQSAAIVLAALGHASRC